MDLGIIVLGVLAVVIFALWVLLPYDTCDKVEEDVPVEKAKKTVTQTDVELKKMTKAQIELIARDAGVELDKRMTKANMIADLRSKL
jgi:hypothetical protein